MLLLRWLNQLCKLVKWYQASKMNRNTCSIACLYQEWVKEFKSAMQKWLNTCVSISPKMIPCASKESKSRNCFAQNLSLFQDAKRYISLFWTSPNLHEAKKKNMCVYHFTVRRPSLIFGPDPKLFYATFSRKLFKYPIFAFQCSFWWLMDNYFDKNKLNVTLQV